MDGACTPATITLMGWKSGKSVSRRTLPFTTCSTMPGRGLSRLVCSISKGSKPASSEVSKGAQEKPWQRASGGGARGRGGGGGGAGGNERRTA